MKQTAVEWLENQIKNSKYYFKLMEEINSRSTIAQHNVFEQAKEMEKEHMCDFADFVATYTDKNKNHKGDLLHAKSKYDGAERTIDLLEEYYNETKLRKLVKSSKVKPITKKEHESLRINAYKPIK